MRGLDRVAMADGMDIDKREPKVHDGGDEVRAQNKARAEVVPGPGSHNLPAQLTSFVGREREKAEIKRLLAATRLITLTGAGGAGKSRLAIEAAREMVDPFPDGVWLAELGPLSDAALVPQVVAAAAGLRDQSERPPLEALAMHLRGKRLLLVLDNCEHLVEVCARIVDLLLRSCPCLR